MDARECCEDIVHTYEAYTAALKKWVRLGTPATLRRCRELHNKIQEELVGGIPFTKSNPKLLSGLLFQISGHLFPKPGFGWSGLPVPKSGCLSLEPGFGWSVMC